MKEDTLPALPPSDEGALERNHYDGYYNIKARDFWSGNQIERIIEKSPTKCDHEFTSTENGAVCKKCHFGLVGKLEVRKGKLFHEGNSIGL